MAKIVIHSHMPVRDGGYRGFEIEKKGDKFEVWDPIERRVVGKATTYAGAQAKADAELRAWVAAI